MKAPVYVDSPLAISATEVFRENTDLFDDEIKEVNQEKITDKFTKEELTMAEQLIDNMSGKFNPADYKDNYKERLQDAINKKIAGKRVSKPKEVQSKKISNLMDALTESIKATKKTKGK